MTFKTLQAEHKVWLERMYPNQPAALPAAGMVEEAGELLHALLAKWRQDMYGKDPRYSDIGNDVRDAVGDCVVYLCSYCNTVEWDLAQFDCSHIDSCKQTPIDLAVNLVAVASEFYTTHDSAYATLYVAILKQICYGLLLDLNECVKFAWSKVKERTR